MKHQAATWILAATLTVTGAGVAVASPASPMAWRQKGYRATHALNMLEAQGFTRFSHFRSDGGNFIADVEKHGVSMQVTIDPRTDQIFQNQSATL